MEENLYFDLVAFGKSSVDFTYVVESDFSKNGKAPIFEENISGGGQAATSAVITSLLGGRSAYVGNIGWDELGLRLLKEFRRYGVNCQWVERPNNFKTPKAIILVDRDSGDRKVFYQNRQKDYCCPLPLEALKNTKMVILDPDISDEDLEKVKTWKNSETLVMYDAERYRPSLNSMKKFADFFIASESLLDIDPTVNRQDAIMALTENVRGELIITFGEKGSVWWKEKKTPIHIPVTSIDKVRDTTGAGDVFHAAFGYFYPRLKDVLLTLKYATHCAGASTTFLGTRRPINYHEGLSRAVENLQEIELQELPEWMLYR